MNDKTKRIWWGFTDAEIRENLKREEPEHKAKERQEEIEAGTSRVERLKKLVRETLRREAEQRGADEAVVAQMTDLQKHQHFSNQKVERLEAMARDRHRPKYWAMALADIRGEEIKAANAQREQREREDGTLERREKIAQARETAIDEARAEVAEARDALARAEVCCREDEQTAREQAQRELEELESEAVPA